MSSRSFSHSRPYINHLVRPKGGLSGELYDLRRDIEGAFIGIEGELGVPEAALQAEWYISSAGSDSNNGATAASPLKSFSELMRRLRGQTIDQYTKVTILDYLDEDCVLHDFGISENGRLHITGVLTVLHTGTLTNVQGIVYPTNVPIEIEDTALPAGWGADGYMYKRIRAVNGQVAGDTGWVGKDTGSKRALASEWLYDAPNAETGPIPLPFWMYGWWPATGDDYEILEATSVRSLSVANVWMSSKDDNNVGDTQNVRLVVEDLDILSPDRTLCLVNGSGITAFIHCSIRNLVPGTAGTTYTYGCHMSGTMGSQTSFQGAQMEDICSLVTSVCILGGLIWKFTETVFLDSAGIVVLDKTTVFMSWCGVIDCSGFIITSGTHFRMQYKLYGSNPAATYGIDVQGGALVTYRNAPSSFTITGGSAQFRVYDTARSNAQIPYTHPTAMAGIIQEVP